MSSNKTKKLKLHNWAGADPVDVAEINDNFTEVDTEFLRIEDVFELGNYNNKNLWTPPTMPDTLRGNGRVPSGYNPDEQLAAMFDPLMKADPGYVSKVSLGKDTSGQYDVWKYTFTPKKYTKTIVLSAMTHGNEYTGFYALAQFMELVTTRWKEFPQLAYLRKNVRIITVPIVNPWGHANEKRQNFNLVDLNRNTDVFWENFTSTKGQVGQIYYKGPQPFSENESQYMRDLFASVGKDFVAYIDFHTINTIIAELIAFGPRYMDQDVNVFADVIQGLYKPGDKIVYGSSAVPSTSNYAAKNFNVTAGNPEWCNGLRGTKTRDSVEMTAVVEYFGNIIIRAGMIDTKTDLMVLNEPFSTVLSYTNTPENINPITVNSRIYTNVPNTLWGFEVKRTGMFKSNGFVEVTLSEECTLTIKPQPYQSYSPDFSWSKIKDNDLFAKTLTLPAGRHTIDLNSVITVFPTNYNSATTSRPEAAKFRIRCKTNKGTVTLERMCMVLEYVPTNRGFAMQILDASGNEQFPEETNFVRTYPNPDKYETSDEES